MQDEASTGDLFIKRTLNSVDSEVIRFQRSSGNVGIGTTSPDSKLTVSNTSSGSDFIGVLIENLGGTVNSNATLSLRPGNLSTARGLITAVAPGGSDAELALYTSNSNGTPSEKVRINDIGNVGIGTTTPAALLEIKGSVSDSATTDLFRVTNHAGSATGRAAIGFFQSNGSYFNSAQISSLPGSSFNSSKMFFSVANSSRVLQDRVVIDVSGNVGIGTTTPTTNLQVNGTTATSTISATVVNGSVRSTTLGSRIILQDMAGGTCTEITTQSGVMSSKAVACP
jgi:hypothetical protein